MAREVTYAVGLIGHDDQPDAAGARRDLTVRIHDLEAEPWGRDARLRHVGTDVPRPDGALKATGRARYTQDVAPPGLAVAGLVVSPHAHAEVVAVDASAAKALKGVLAVRTREGTRVTHAGQIVAAACAEDATVLEDALRSIRVTYRVRPAAVTTADAMREGAPVVDPRRTGNVEGPRRGPSRHGDPEAAFAGADVLVEGTWRTAIQTHSCLEPHGCTCLVHEDGTATVWASTQATSSFARGELVRALGVPPHRIRVLTHHMGGGFGSKFQALDWDDVCASFAQETGRPVRLMLTRRQEHLVGGNRPDSIQELALAGTRDGRIRGLRGKTWGTAGNATGGGAGAANFAVYEFPALSMEQNSVATFTARGCAFRAPRHPQGVFALEGLLDRYAAAIGMDPLDLRLRNDRHPVRRVQWRLGAERIGWKALRARAADTGPLRRGVGCAASRWGQAGRHDVGREPLRVEVRVDREGGVVVQCAVQDIGTGTRAVMAILAAEELGLRPSDVDARVGDTEFPPGPGSGGSTTAPSIGPAVRNAALRAREAVAARLANSWGVAEDAVRWEGGGYRGPDGRRAAFREACAALDEAGVRVHGERRPNWDGAFGETAGCQFAEVVVDVETGVVRVERVVAVHDCGRVIDTLTARSQVNGGVIQGISFALFEEKLIDRNLGDMVNPRLDTYRILGMADCPAIDVLLTSVVSGYNNAGMMGLGEPATVPTAAAVANAVFHAIGVQPTDLPMTPARILATLERGRG